MPDRSLALALSGGGHRATIFTLGALMYVVEAGRAADTTSIASVSGGSLTNGLIAQTLDFRKADAATFEREVVKPLAGQIAQRGTLFVPWLSKLYLLLLGLGFPAAFLPAFLLQAGWGARLGAVVALLLAWGWLAGKRGWICGQAFRSTLFAPNGAATLLRNVASEVCHVICSTELRSAQSVYFSGDFVYAYALGPGRPDDLPLYQAVQASAAFPGGFPPTWLPARRLEFQGRSGQKKPDLKNLILTDGGVYDNMGDQWARGFADRVTAWPWLAGKAAPKQLVVINASARVPWSPFRRGRIPLLGEIFSFLRVTDVMYVNTTNVRRQEVVRSYDPAAPARRGPLPGVLIQIAQSPFDVARFFAGSDSPEVVARAKTVLQGLGATADQWSKIARLNSAVPTTLSKLGAEVTARLLYQGYVTAMCNLHVVFGGTDPELGGWPLLPVPDLGKFARLVE